MLRLIPFRSMARLLSGLRKEMEKIIDELAADPNPNIVKRGPVFPFRTNETRPSRTDRNKGNVTAPCFVSTHVITSRQLRGNGIKCHNPSNRFYSFVSMTIRIAAQKHPSSLHPLMLRHGWRVELGQKKLALLWGRRFAAIKFYDCCRKWSSFFWVLFRLFCIYHL